MISAWITDRKTTKADACDEGWVWVWSKKQGGRIERWHHEIVGDGVPWHSSAIEPYVVPPQPALDTSLAASIERHKECYPRGMGCLDMPNCTCVTCDRERIMDAAKKVDDFEARIGMYEQENKELIDLVGHCWVHSSYEDCGYRKMTTQQKQERDDLQRRCDEVAEEVKQEAARFRQKGFNETGRMLNDLAAKLKGGA